MRRVYPAGRRDQPIFIEPSHHFRRSVILEFRFKKWGGSCGLTPASEVGQKGEIGVDDRKCDREGLRTRRGQDFLLDRQFSVRKTPGGNRSGTIGNDRGESDRKRKALLTPGRSPRMKERSKKQSERATRERSASCPSVFLAWDPCVAAPKPWRRRAPRVSALRATTGRPETVSDATPVQPNASSSRGVLLVPAEVTVGERQRVRRPLPYCLADVVLQGRRRQAVRQRSAKLSIPGSVPAVASIYVINGRLA